MQPVERPFISFLTDFGADAAAAICRGVMLGIARDAQIVDVSHGVRKYAIRDGAFLLWISLPSMPVGVHVAVVDPGVGTPRRPIGLRTGRGDVLVGPDNGLLRPAAAALGGITEARVLANRSWMLSRISSTFHGRDIFSPVAAHLAIGGRFEEVGPTVDVASLVTLDFADPVVGDGVLDTTVVYIDSFGNLRLGAVPDDFARAFDSPPYGTAFEVEFGGLDGGPAHVERAPWVRTFGEVAAGAALLYADSFGLLAFADNQASVADRLGIAADRAVRITLDRGRSGPPLHSDAHYDSLNQAVVARTRRTSTRIACPAASSSASPSCAPSPWSRACCSLTRSPAPSTRS